MHRIVCAADCGYVVNSDTMVTQIEGAIVYGLIAAFYDKITIKGGRVEQSNFDDYPMLRLKAMPTIEVVQVPSGGFWGGVGEVGLPPRGAGRLRRDLRRDGETDSVTAARRVRCFTRLQEFLAVALRERRATAPRLIA